MFDAVILVKLVLLTSCGSRSPLSGSVGKDKMSREKDPVWNHFERTINQNKTISRSATTAKQQEMRMLSD